MPLTKPLITEEEKILLLRDEVAELANLKQEYFSYQVVFETATFSSVRVVLFPYATQELGKNTSASTDVNLMALWSRHSWERDFQPNQRQPHLPQIHFLQSSLVEC